MEEWKPDLNDETEPRVTLNTTQGEFLANRGNARLYTFLGHTALYDHVFCTNEGDRGFYIFNFIEGFNRLKEYMLANEFPAYINQTEIAQCDVDAYDRVIQRSMGDIDYVPDEWLPET